MGKDRDNQGSYMYVNLDEYVPQDHILRAIRDNIDFTFIYDKIKPFYSDRGRRSIDPVKLIKMLLIGYIFGIASERQIEEQVKLNLAYRWFLNLDLVDCVPDHSTISQNRRRRFKESKIFQELFDEIVRRCVSEEFVTGEIVVTDSTHVKASASDQRKEVIEVKCKPSDYVLELDKEAEKLQKKIRWKKGCQGKNGSKKQEAKEKTKEIVVSTTDPDSGYMNRPNKPKGFHYLNHMSIDTKNGIITDIYVTPGNTSDHEPYINRLRVQEEKFGLDIQKIGADRGYDYMNVHYGLDKMGIEGYIPEFKRRPKKEGFSLDKFLYDSNKDKYICPEGKLLSLAYISRTSRTKVYTIETEICQQCPVKDQCTTKTVKRKVIERPIHQDYADKTHAREGTEEYIRIQKLRSIWCEGTNGILKENHNLTRTRKKGKANVLEHCLLSALVINIKRYLKALKNKKQQQIAACLTIKSLQVLRKWLGNKFPSHICQQAPWCNP